MKLDNFLKKLISFLFPALFFLVPLFFTPVNSELFEFNKIILVYLATILITGAWVGRMIIQKRLIFNRTFLDIPLALFLASQVISTLFSIDRHTSMFGYYSRFNGSLLSTICYSLLYWVFVSNCVIEDIKKIIKFSLISAVIVSVYGILEHFGYSFSCLMFTKQFNVACWVQDVKNRVFATLGQPNWLAAYLAALVPLTWHFALNPNYELRIKNKGENFAKPIIHYSLFIILILCLLFTDSRSGFLGLAVSAIVFWLLVLKQNKENLKVFRKPFLILNSLFIILIFVFGSPFPQLNKYFSLKSLVSHFSSLTSRPTSQIPPPTSQTDTQIVIGGTESSAIRKIVWQGAVDIFKHYPLFGSGVETFAFSYYQFRPLAHNLVSEWDFLYNKAHNEYLNYLATTGIIGLGTYLFFIGSFVFWSLKNYTLYNVQCINKNGKKGNNYTLYILHYALFSGWLSLLITNFFGFSVVVTSLYFFLIPALSFVLIKNQEKPSSPIKNHRLSTTSYIFLSLLSLTTIYLLLTTINIWKADYYYAKAEKFSKQGEYATSFKNLSKAVKLFPTEPVFQNETASVLASLTYLTKDTQSTVSAELIDNAIALSSSAIATSPKNLNFWKTRVKVFYTLSLVKDEYLTQAIDATQGAIKIAPTDPKLVYNLGLLYGKAGQTEKALETLLQAIKLKPNYADARNALSLYYEDLGENEKAIEQLEYILKNISPDSQEAKERIEKLKSR